MKQYESSNRSSNFDRFSRESLRREREVLKFAWEMARRYHLLLLLAMLLGILIGVFPAVVIYFFQDTVGGAGHDLLSLVSKENFVLVILLLFVYLLFQKGVSVITTFAIIDVEYNIRMKYLSKILAFSIEDISKNLDKRSAFSMTRETTMTSGLIPMIYRSFLQAPVTIVSAVILLLVISSRMLALVMVMMVVIVGISLLMRSRLKHFHRKQYDAMSSLLQYFNEWLSGHRIFHIYGAEDFYKRKMTSAFDSIADVSRRHKLYETAQSISVEILTYIAVILFILFLSNGDESVNIGIVLSFPALILLIRGEILKLVAGYQQLANTESSITRLQQVLQMEASAENGSIWKEQIEDIELKNITYGYDAQEIILHHSCLMLSRGRVNVLTGPNGTGKSTTINLILGLLRPQDGGVYYNGKDIKGYTTTSLLTQFAIVEQEPFVFQDSLFDNITLGRDISEETVRTFLQDFSLDYLVGDEGNLSLRIGDRGRALSLGEKQRLALIRALVGNPSVIILDEPTSNIDYATAAFIRETMTELAKQHLVICISHDPMMTTNNELHIFQIENGNYIQRYAD